PAEHDTRSKAVPRPLSRKHLIPFPLMVVLIWISFPSCLRAQPVDPFSRLFGDAAGKQVEELRSETGFVSGRYRCVTSAQGWPYQCSFPSDNRSSLSMVTLITCR